MSSVTIPVRTIAVDPLRMSRGKVLRAHLTDTKYEFIRLMRNPMFFVPMVGMPVGLYVFIGIYMAYNINLPIDIKTLHTGGFVNWTIFGLMGPAMMSFGIGVAAERDVGAMAFKRALPMPPSAYLLSKLVAALLFGCVVISLMTLAAMLLSESDLTLTQYAQLFAAGTLLPLANLGWVGMSMVGGLLFPIPKWLAMSMPTYYASQLNKGIAGLPTEIPTWVAAGVLTAITVILGLLSINRINAVNDD
jgi:ABC-2 type transport system permease protein